MLRRCLRTLWPAAVALVLLAFRAEGCKKAPQSPPPPGPKRHGTAAVWYTPLLTAPPKQITVPASMRNRPTAPVSGATPVPTDPQ